MKYSLKAELTYLTYAKEASFVDARFSQRQMMEIAQDYLNDPELTSAVFTVIRQPIRKEVSDD